MSLAEVTGTRRCGQSTSESYDSNLALSGAYLAEMGWCRGLCWRIGLSVLVPVKAEARPMATQIDVGGGC